MSLTAISSLEWARRKFFINANAQHVKKLGIKRFWAEKAEMTSNSHQLAGIEEKKFS